MLKMMLRHYRLPPANATRPPLPEGPWDLPTRGGAEGPPPAGGESTAPRVTASATQQEVFDAYLFLSQVQPAPLPVLNPSRPALNPPLPALNTPLPALNPSLPALNPPRPRGFHCGREET
eukprot:39064-Prorocentrum_minimum.AAC.3